MGHELRSKSQHNLVKTISIYRFQVEILIDNPADLTGDFIVKSLIGEIFDDFRNIMRREKLEGLFRSTALDNFLA